MTVLILDMTKALVLAFLWTVCSCPLPDGSAAAPYFVDSASTSRPASGSQCAPFLSLEAALNKALDVPATVFLQSAVSMSARNISTAVTLSANANVLDLKGRVLVTGTLAVLRAALNSRLLSEFVLEVTGSLVMDSCNLTSFTSLPLLVQGLVFVTNSRFQGNTRGVFASFALGANLTVTQSWFSGNAQLSGAVLFVSPAGGNGATHYLLADCVFEGNGRKGGNSVLSLYDSGSLNSLQKHTIFFSRCNFKAHPSPTFQLVDKLFVVHIQESHFENETQLLTGTVLGANVTLDQVSVTESAGPLFVLQLTGVFSLTSSNFTDIGSGPLITAVGIGVSSSLLLLSQVYLAHISNRNPNVHGNLLNAQDCSIYLNSVRIEHFSASVIGIFGLYNSVLVSQHFSAKNGSAESSIIGNSLFSVFSMNDTYFEAVNSGGSMWSFFHCSINLTGITYRQISGFLIEALGLQSTNLFVIRSDSEAQIDGLDIVTMAPGTPLFYVYNATLNLSHSAITGPVGLSTLTSNGSVVRLRQVAFNITSAFNMIDAFAGGVIDVDQITLRNTVVTFSLCALSSESTVFIRSLVLNNVTCSAVTSGQHFTVVLQEVRIDNSRIGTLVYSGIVV